MSQTHQFVPDASRLHPRLWRRSDFGVVITIWTKSREKRS